MLALVVTVSALDVVCGVLVWQEVRPERGDLAVEVVAAVEPVREQPQGDDSCVRVVKKPNAPCIAG